MSVRTLRKARGGQPGKYEVRYRELGRHRSRTFDLKGDAEAFDSKARLARQRGESIRRPSETDPLDTFAVGWKARREGEGVAPNTVKANASLYNNWIAPYVGAAKIGELTVPALDGWRQEIRDAGASVETVRRAVGLLSMILGDALRRGEIGGNPAASLGNARGGHARRKGRPPTIDQVERMRNWFLANDDPRGAAAISVLAYVGLRPEEGRALEPDTFNGEAFDLRDDQTKDKTPARRAPVPKPIRKELKALDTPVLFVRSDGEPFTDTDYRNWRRRQFRDAAGEARLLDWDAEAKEWTGDFRPYDLRHFAGSLKVRAGEPLPEIAADLGHSVETLIRTYTHEISEMRGRPVEPVEKAIRGARVRNKYGGKKKAAPAKRRNRSRMGSPERDSNS